ncbi:MAG TPA: hypothetical protein VF824_06300 [Thermoanaerobaculia bacterium]|jgi:hypothetical protein
MKRFALALLLALPVALPLLAQEAPAPAPPPNDDEFTKAFYFGKKFADLGEYASAYEQFAKADALKRDQPAVVYDMAVVLARAGRYSDAQVAVERYNRLFPNGAEKAQVAKLQLELDFQRELQKKRQAEQEYADLFNRARFVYGRGELEEALRLFRQAEQLRPADPSPVYNEAMVLEKQGDFANAIERYRRYAELETDSVLRGAVDERVFTLQRELDDMRTKLVCPFCGHKLPAGATWCERCWHGPYLVKSAVWNSRPCVEGATATRTTFFADDRFNRNDVLPCLAQNGTLLESLRYTPARQRTIQDARKAEGWTYVNGVLQGNKELQYVQGRDYLERVTSSSGDILTYAAHANGEGVWLLDREDLVVDAQRYTNRYSFDAAGRIAQQQVTYQNNAACGHVIGMTADYNYAGDQLASATIQGGYEGYAAEGAPETKWQAAVNWTYDENGRVTKEDLAVTSLQKTYTQKPQGALRDDIARVFPGMRVKKPLENVHRSGDLCGTSGTAVLANLIDLRPFYALSPSLAIALPNGVTKAVTTFTYPAGYRP